MDMDKTERSSDQVEDVNADKLSQHGGNLIMPASLAALSQEEYERIGKKATLKMDLVIMPIMVIMYILNYLDRQNIASAKLADITTDLNLSQVEYQTTVSILFVGYILMQVPSNMIVGKIKWPGAYICCGMAAWGVISSLMAVVHNYEGLLMARFFLGFVEAIFFPGALYFLSLFYNRKQFALRTAILYSGSQLGNAFGGLFAIAILNLDGAHGLAGWRWLFLVEGVITVGLAIPFACILPNSNKKIPTLTQLECEWVQYNFAADQGQEDNSSEVTAMKGFMMAVTDPKTWMLMGVLYSTYIVGAVANFFPSVVGGLGFSRTMTYALTAPPFLLCVITMLLNGFHSDRKQERFLHIVIPLCITLVANIIAVSTTNTAARYVAMMLLPGSFYAAAVVVLSWITGSLAQPSVKRASAIALINAMCNTPNIWGSYLYYGAPRYVTAFIVNIAATGLAIGFATVTRIWLRRLNAKLDRGEDTGKHGPTQAQVAGGFRYLI
ncbi:TNA1 is necessary for nicotinic acid import into the cell [Colletotrichum tamarilloi]|uniref:TNA1 is necessary for nicotinic acid import into the cell n=1 Tax=Colletotrichum tamarilloi TaxID=1209934 RepID=A0ABQ9R4N7_9PEZI|nr:TNA1 is necessary for nicotinic acid import into the cell [Colletotrichum tamarilloi]KAI3532411.1 TNA1 is necessary for nicotinic acid import into the cell [Colletotrichum filicis]KAK1494579.1 TNA1 is necessary for nicotinic acid import into the cell [Colletotrichum tamarilloi]